MDSQTLEAANDSPSDLGVQCLKVVYVFAGHRRRADVHEHLIQLAQTLCENVASYVWWHHRFLSVAFAWFYPYLVFTTVHICYVDGFSFIATSIAYG